MRDAFGGGHGPSLPVMRFVRNRGQVPDRGAQPIVVVPVDPAGDLPVDVTEVAPGVAADFGRQQTDGRLAQGVLSRASPTVPIGGDPGFEQFRGQSHGRAGGIQRPACLEQRDADLRHPCSPDLWASCRRHVGEVTTIRTTLRPDRQVGRGRPGATLRPGLSQGAPGWIELAPLRDG